MKIRQTLSEGISKKEEILKQELKKETWLFKESPT